MFDYLKDTCLYYPCSGPDWLVPIQRFAPHIREFWFVDPYYFRNYRPSYDSTQSLSSGEYHPKALLEDYPEFTLIDSRVEGDLTAKEQTRTDPNNGIESPIYIPCTVTERYLDSKTAHEFIVHRHRGDGQHALGLLTTPLGVFFHRGDNGPNGGEGASGSHWLSKEWLTPVLNKLVDGGMIVSDGSCGREYPEISKHQRSTLGEAVVDATVPFTDSDGRAFKCIGYAGERYGPTLIWQVNKPK